MKHLLVFFTLLFSLNLYAASDMAFQGNLGLQAGRVHVGADLDFQKRNSHSFGGFFIFAPEQDNRTSPGVSQGGFWGLGGDVKAFFGADNWKLYLGPGVGIMNFEAVGGDPSETTLGTVFKVGALIEVSYDMYFGMEHMMIQNWFTDKIFGSVSITSLSFRINL